MLLKTYLSKTWRNHFNKNSNKVRLFLQCFKKDIIVLQKVVLFLFDSFRVEQTMWSTNSKYPPVPETILFWWQIKKSN